MTTCCQAFSGPAPSPSTNRWRPLLDRRRQPRPERLRGDTTCRGRRREVLSESRMRAIRTSGCVSSEGWHVQQEKGLPGRELRSPVVWIAGWRETETLKPIDNVSLGKTTSHRAVTTVNAKVASKVRSPEGRVLNRRAKAAWGSRNLTDAAPSLRRGGNLARRRGVNAMLRAAREAIRELL